MTTLQSNCRAKFPSSAIPLVILWLVSGWIAVIEVEAEDRALTLFRASPGITEVLSANRQLTLVGRREQLVEGGLSLDAFLRYEGKIVDVPIPEQFTNIELGSISDSQWIAGFATRPLGHPERNQQALVLNATTREIQMLPVPAGVRDTCAFDISADGQRVTGYVISRDPPRLAPAVWIRQADEWQCQFLSVLHPYNPLLVTAHVVISDDGQTIASSLVRVVEGNEIRAYGLYVWKLTETGEWQRAQVSDRAVHLANMNDRGQIVGRVLENGRRRPFLYDPASGERLLPVPAGARHVQTTDINEAGEIVGVSEDPPGPEGSSHAVLWVNGELQPIEFGFPVYLSTANTITDAGVIGGMLQRAPADSRQSAEPVAAPDGDSPAEESPIDAYLWQKPK